MSRFAACLVSLLALSAQAFAQSPAQPSIAVDQGRANLPGQTLGANDLLAISVYGAPELTRTVRVSAQGEIRLPMLKSPVRADGMLPAALETAIAAALKSDGILVNPIVTVTVAEYASRPISIMGAVKRPLTLQAVGPMTLLDALARAEGLAAEAGPEILVSRPETHADGSVTTAVRRIPVKALLGDADSQFNIALQGGEEIRVPEGGKIFVVGNVKRPGSFRVPDSGEMTLLQILAVSEGLLPYSSKHAYIYRQGSTAKETAQVVDLARILARKAPDVGLAANDILYVPVDQGRQTTMGALGKLLTVGAATLSGILIYGTIR